jgi:hypothetical protein
MATKTILTPTIRSVGYTQAANIVTKTKKSVWLVIGLKVRPLRKGLAAYFD